MAKKISAISYMVGVLNVQSPSKRHVLDYVTRGSQDTGSHNLGQAFFMYSVEKTNEAKSVAGTPWLRLSPSVALLRGRVWSSLGIRWQQ